MACRGVRGAGQGRWRPTSWGASLVDLPPPSPGRGYSGRAGSPPASCRRTRVALCARFPHGTGTTGLLGTGGLPCRRDHVGFHDVRVRTASTYGASTPEESDMNEAKRWTVVIDIDEHEGKTRAVARL